MTSGADAGPSLESADGWTPARLAERRLPARTSVQDLLSLAQRHDLNPGLLAEAVLRFPDRDPADLALTLRASLTATVGQPRTERLRRVVRDLGADPTRTEEWEQALR